MSVQVPSSYPADASVKRSKTTKRKYRDVSQIVATPERLPPPTKKVRHFQDQASSIEAQVYATPEPESKSELFFTRAASFYLPIAPISLQSPIAGLCEEHLSSLRLTYYPPLKGVIVCYSNPRLCESSNPPSKSQESRHPILALSVAEYGPAYIWFTADFLVLAPSTGSRIEGLLTLQSETHLSLVCWNLFNAIVPRERLPRDWKWIEGTAEAHGKKKKRSEKLKGRSGADEDTSMVDLAEDSHDVQAEHPGHWVDGQGLEISGKITFSVVMIDADGGNDQEGNFVSIVGTMLTKIDETKLLEQEEQLWEKRRTKKSSLLKENKDLASGTALKNSNTKQNTNKPEGSSNRQKLRN